MATIIKYSKKALSNVVDIISGADSIGYIEFSAFKSSFETAINGKQYLFKKKSFWSADLQVYKVDNEQFMAEINFALWSQKIEISLANGEKFLLKKKSIWNGNNWTLENASSELINFEQTKYFWNDEGQITITSNDSEKTNLLALISLAAIYITRRRAAAAAS
jgi:hypothetical protein